jgi:NADH-quinone oxidoreductase subunit E
MSALRAVACTRRILGSGVYQDLPSKLIDACMLRGEEDLKAVCRKRIGEPDRTADGTFSWIEVECLGACVNAPMRQINEDNYEDLDPDILNRILDDLASGRIPKPGPQIDRPFFAPIGGPTTLKAHVTATPGGLAGESSSLSPQTGGSPPHAN